MNIIEIYKKETLVPKIILATLTALIIISFMEFLYDINTYTCSDNSLKILLSDSDTHIKTRYMAFNGAEFSNFLKCVALTKPLFLKASFLSVLFPILLMSFWLLIRIIFKKNENKLKSFFEFFEINKLDRGLFRIGLVLSWPWVVFVCIYMQAVIPLRASRWTSGINKLEVQLDIFFTGLAMLTPIILFPLIWLLLKKVGIWIYKGFK
jgi:hypothetical protein|tara:strand:- start:8 stop:631 length:624 start_codon:yes stop_codon:yes gene_type:complete